MKALNLGRLFKAERDVEEFPLFRPGATWDALAAFGRTRPGSTATPASVIRSLWSGTSAKARFRLLHRLPGRRGVNRTAYVSAPMVFARLSIHP